LERDTSPRVRTNASEVIGPTRCCVISNRACGFSLSRLFLGFAGED